MSKKLTSKEVINRIEQHFPNKFNFNLFFYKNKRTKIKLICKDCNNIIEEYLPVLLSRKEGCLYCINKIRKYYKRLTHQEFIDKIKIFHKNIIIKSIFINLKSIIECECSICNTQWKTSANNLNRGVDCPKCAYNNINNNSKEKAEIKYKKSIKEKFPYIEALEEYILARTKLKFKCNLCGNIFISDYSLLYKTSSGCPKCNSAKRMPLQKALNLLKKYHPNLILKTKNYKGICIKYKFYCSKCNKYFITSLSNLIHNRSSCPSCKRSSGERIFESYLRELNLNYIPQYIFKDCKEIRPYRFDYYIQDFNLIVEIMGDQHYKSIEYFGGLKSFEIIQKRDEIKRIYCKTHDVNYLEINYSQLNDSSYKNILNNFIAFYINN